MKHYSRLKIVNGDLLAMDVEAIVNPANTSLLGGGGVDRAIHQAAGVELQEFCRTLGGCKTGDAVHTPGFKLKQKHIIHTVGPVYDEKNQNSRVLLENCYKNSLEIASRLGIRTIAFPEISTGAFRYPKNEARMISEQVCLQFLETNSHPEMIFLVRYE